MEIGLLSVFQFLTIGTVVGFLGGLLGIGGGVVVVPLLLFWAFPAIGVHPQNIMHLACGTSLASIVPAALSSAWAHTRAGNVNWQVTFRLILPGVLSSFLGSSLSSKVHGALLQELFAWLLILLALQLFFQEAETEETIRSFPPDRAVTILIGFLVGGFSGFFGVGGGVIAVPLLHRFQGLSIRHAIGISISFILFTALVGTGGYVYSGWGQQNLPAFALGFVHTPAWILMAVPSIFFARWGAQLARRIHLNLLKQAFALLMMCVGLRMLY